MSEDIKNAVSEIGQAFEVAAGRQDHGSIKVLILP